jgi:hypothetical protein
MGARRSVVRDNPRISANKLGEYLTARPARRRAILRDQKRPVAFKAARYVDAYEAVTTSILDPEIENEDLMLRAIDLRATSSGSQWQDQDRALSAEMIEEFIELRPELELDRFLCDRVDRFAEARVRIEGVDVSVRPDVLLTAASGSREPRRGAVKLSFVKTNPLGTDGSEYVATIVRHYLEHAAQGEVDYRNIFVVDVPSGLVTRAPRAWRARFNDVRAACQEIRALWPQIRGD